MSTSSVTPLQPGGGEHRSLLRTAVLPAVAGVLAAAVAVAYLLVVDQTTGRANALVAVLAALGVAVVTHGFVTRPKAPWRTVDIVTAAVLAVACGVVFRAWAELYNAVKPAFTAFPPGQAVVYGMWFLAAALVPMIIRRPGAAVFAEVVAATLEFLLLSQYGPLVIVYGLLQGLAAEAVWAAFRYRRWGLVPALLAGGAAGLVAGLLDTNLTYVAWSTGWKLAYVPTVMVSGALLSGLVAWWLVRALAPTGALSAFASGRQRELV